VLSLDGVRHQLGGLARTRATRLAERLDGCGFRLPGRGVTVEGAVEAPGKDLVGWVYADRAAAGTTPSTARSRPCAWSSTGKATNRWS
jgi:hypothetical protein